MLIIKNYLYNLTYQIFLMIIPIVTMPYISRVLGPQSVGINSYTFAVTNYFALFGLIGLNVYGQREIAYVRGDPIKSNKIFWEIEILSFMTNTTVLILFLIYALFIGQQTSFLLAYSVLIIANLFDISWLLIGLEKFGILSIRNFIIKAIMLFLIFKFVKSRSDLIIYILINSVGTLVSNLTLWPYIKKVGWPIKAHELKPFRHLKAALMLFIPQLSISIYTVFNRIMLGQMSSLEDVAYFDFSDKIVRMSFSVLISLSTVLMPLASYVAHSGDYTKLKKILKQSLSFSFMISFPMMFGLMALSKRLIPLFLGSQYSLVSSILFVQVFMIVPMSIANVLGNQYLVPSNNLKNYNYAVIFGGITNVVCNIPLIYLYGVLGATISVVLSEIVVAGYQMFTIRKQFPLIELFGDWYKYLFSALIMYLFLFTLQKYISGWSGIIICIFFATAAYFVLLKIISPRYLKSIFEKGKLK